MRSIIVEGLKMPPKCHGCDMIILKSSRESIRATCRLTQKQIYECFFDNSSIITELGVTDIRRPISAIGQIGKPGWCPLVKCEVRVEEVFANCHKCHKEFPLLGQTTKIKYWTCPKCKKKG